MLTGARYPNITKNWHEYDESNSNNITPGSYWHPESWITKGDDLPSVDLSGAVLVPLRSDGGAHVGWIDPDGGKPANSNEFKLAPYASGTKTTTPTANSMGPHPIIIMSQFFLTAILISWINQENGMLKCATN